MSDSFDLDQTLRGHIPGERVFDRYKLIKTLGQGGMGVVWLAIDEQLEREVALKFLPEQVAHDPAAINDLKRETKKALKLTHPNIVRIYDFLQNKEMVAVSMEHVDGRNLTQIRLDKENQAFSTEQIEKWVEQICQALDYAHIKEQIAHRDLKPSNLLIDSKGDIKITDFGISATISDATTCTQLNASSSGTPVYMCLQQMMGEKAAPTDDIYSLGATIYELLTSKPPFYSGRIDLQLQSIVPPLMRDRRKELGVKETSAISNTWESTVASCLEKAAQDRPQSLAEVWNSIQGKQIILPKNRASKKNGAGRKLFKAICALIILGFTGAAGWYFGTGGFEKETPDIETPPISDKTPVVAEVIPETEKTPEEEQPLVDNNTLEETPVVTPPPKAITDTPADDVATDTPKIQQDAVIGDEDILADLPVKVEEQQVAEIPFPENGPQPNQTWMIPDTGIKMPYINPGIFFMGEKSTHRVTLTEGYWLGSNEVTQAQWEAVMGFNPSKFRNADSNTPIDQVSWSDAMDFCFILTEIEKDAGRLPKGYEYSLPTEAQWEYACRADSTSTFNMGNILDSSMANFDGNYPSGSAQRGIDRQRPLPVGSFAPNEWGLYDMHGNVSEWCYDWYAKYNLRPITDPTGPSTGPGHVTRGGAWYSDGDSCASGARDYEKTESKNSYLGFRIALRPVKK